MTNSVEEKARLRALVKERNEALSGAYLASSNAEICRLVLSLEQYQKANTIFCFVGRNNEIDTLPILTDAWRAGKAVGVPRCVGKGVMEAREIHSLDELYPAKFGLVEPSDDSRLIAPEEIDFAVIPCVSVTAQGHRLGFGGGFYDRYLEGADFPTCILCRGALMLEEVPMEPHDIIPGMLVSETGITRFR